MENTSEFIKHTPCGECGSSDANGLYTDGHQHCFSCGTYTKPEGETAERSPLAVSSPSGLAPIGSPQALPKRRLKEEACQKFSYTVSEFNDQPVQIANYKVAGKVVAQKLRFANKDFRFLGDARNAGLYGQHLWKDGGKQLVITEGEVDAISMGQALGLKWPVVSVPTGSQGAAKAVKNSFEFVSSFDKVIIMMDMDDAGAKAAQEIAALLPPSKAFIANLPLKDASDMLKAGRQSELVDAVWQAKPFRPDGIVDASSLFEEIMADDTTESTPYPWDGLTDKTHGIRKGELTVLTAGSGVGKSSVIREVAFDLLRKGKTVGMLMLEENTKRTSLGMMGLELNKPLHISREGITDEQMKAAFDATCGTGRLFLYDHFGSTEADNLVSKIQYLATGCGCDYIILDHISIAISGLENGDERRMIDNLMTRLRTVVEATGIALFVISHLRRPEGKSHEEGGMTSLSQLRGSHSLAQLADGVLGFERNQQDPETANVITVRVLKNRFSGDTGEACQLAYNKHTGRLAPHDGEIANVFGDAEY